MYIRRRFSNVFFIDQEETKPNRRRENKRLHRRVKTTHSYYVNYTCANFVLIQHIASVLLCGPVLLCNHASFCEDILVLLCVKFLFPVIVAICESSCSLTARSRDGYCTYVASACFSWGAGGRINTLCCNGRLTL